MSFGGSHPLPAARRPGAARQHARFRGARIPCWCDSSRTHSRPGAGAWRHPSAGRSELDRVRTPVHRPARRARPDRVRAALVAEAGDSALADVDRLKDALLDLSAAHPSGIAQLFAGRTTRLSNLVREGSALSAAKRRARAVSSRAEDYAQRYGLASAFLAIGVATWTEEIPEPEPTAGRADAAADDVPGADECDPDEAAASTEASETTEADPADASTGAPETTEADPAPSDAPSQT